MKNLHLLPTEKPSNLFKDIKNKLMFNKDWIEIPIGRVNQNIYITNDEEIRDDYVFAYGVIIKVMMFDVETLYFVNGTKAKREDCKKIILTTDQDLIKDGVQAIDDEFLEWFVNNSSCEEVMLWRFHGINTSIAEVNAISGDGSLNWQGKSDLRDYKIIFPKEEAKQEKLHRLIKEKLDENEPEQENDYSALLQPVGTKQETLEEVAENSTLCPITKMAFIYGAEWQREQDKKMYSDEEVIYFLEQYRYELSSKKLLILGDTTKQWFEQFKNK